MKKETKTLYKFYITIEQEEKFINDMSAKGWKLTNIYLGIGFKFEKCEPNEYIGRCIFVNSKERDDLCEILIDSGAEIVPEVNIDSNVRIYALRKAELGEFAINTGIDSKINEYKTKIKYHLFFGILFIIFALLILLGSYHSTYTLICAIIELLCGLPLMITGIRYMIKVNALKKEREIGE